MFAGNCCLQQILVDRLQHREHIVARRGLQILQDAAVLAHDFSTLLGITKSAFAIEKLAVHVLKIELCGPTEPFGIRHGNCVAVIDLTEQESVRRIDDQTAKYTGHRIARQHRTHARAAAGNNKIGGFGIDQNSRQQTIHDVGERGFIFRSVHTIVEHLMPQWFRDCGQCVMDDRVFCGLTVFGDQCDLHKFPLA